MKCLFAILPLLAATFSVRPLPQAEGPLEPSVQNEVDHAIAQGERWLAEREARDVAEAMKALGLTNGATRTEIALKLISSQRGGGWWLNESNAVPTRVAVEILKGL